MLRLCLLDLVERTGGRLHFAAMPPIDGELTLIGRIVLRPEIAQSSDVFWSFGRSGDAELALLHGALGVVNAGRPIEPLPGRFCLVVNDAVAALKRLVASLEPNTKDAASQAIGPSDNKTGA